MTLPHQEFELFFFEFFEIFRVFPRLAGVFPILAGYGGQDSRKTKKPQHTGKQSQARPESDDFKSFTSPQRRHAGETDRARPGQPILIGNICTVSREAAKKEAENEKKPGQENPAGTKSRFSEAGAGTTEPAERDRLPSQFSSQQGRRQPGNREASQDLVPDKTAGRTSGGGSSRNGNGTNGTQHFEHPRSKTEPGNAAGHVFG